MQQNINCWCPIKQLTKGPGNGFVAEMIFGSQKNYICKVFGRETRENGSEGAVLEVLAIFGKYVSYSAIKSKN